MKKILCFGNPMLPEDNLAIKIAKNSSFPGFELIACDSPQEVLQHQDAYAIMDISYGIEEIKVLDDFSKLRPMNMSSLHDFDLSFFLKLMERLGKIKQMKLIALPVKGKEEKIKEELSKLLLS